MPNNAYLRPGPHLIVLSDGSWKGRQDATVIGRLADALALSPGDDPHHRRRVFYDPGVAGIAGGLFGKGLAANVRQAYSWLQDHHEPGAVIILIGYSRGAFTVRSLAGMIGAAGLNLPTRDAWRAYRAGRSIEGLATHIANLIAVDTVGALGVPRGPISRRRNAFHDTSLGPHVLHALHICAAHERRRAFQPTHFEQSPRVVTEWFRGTHTDLGTSDRVYQRIADELRAEGLSLGFAATPQPVSEPKRVWKVARGLAWRALEQGQVDHGAIEAARHLVAAGRGTPADRQIIDRVANLYKWKA